MGPPQQAGWDQVGGSPPPVPAALTVRPCSSWTQPAGSIHSWAGPRAFFPKADVLFMFYSGAPASVLGRRRAACVWVSLLGAPNQTDLWLWGWAEPCAQHLGAGLWPWFIVTSSSVTREGPHSATHPVGGSGRKLREAGRLCLC